MHIHKVSAVDAVIAADAAAVDPLVPTVFHEPWWLEVATEGRFHVVEVSEHGRVVGRLPYFLEKRMGMTKGVMPPLTHFLGPAIAEGDGKPDYRFLKRFAITKALIEKLPRTSLFYIKCHRDITDVIAFQAKDFRSSVQFTHEIHPASKDVLWNNLRHERRRVILRAMENVDISAFDDVEAYARFYRANLDAKDLRPELNMAVCSRLIEACLSRGRGKILVAKDKRGELQAAIFYAWDTTALYYLMTTRAPSSGNGTVSTLVWHAIQEAAQKNLIFDFDGVSSEGSVSFSSGFGATISPRYIVARETTLRRLVVSIRSLIKPDSFYYYP